jgi:hypothetical protein
VQKYSHEYNQDAEWFKHAKHVMIFTFAGRPIFTRYGDENKLAAYMGVICAFITNFQRMGDSIKCFFAGNTKFVFLYRGPIYLVAISRTPESVRQLQIQLAASYEQFVSVLTGNVSKMIEDRPNYDVRSLMGGTEMLINDIVNISESKPSFMLDAIQALRVKKEVRTRIFRALQKGAKSKNTVYSILLADGKLVSLYKTDKRNLFASDLSILSNFVTNSQSLRSSESWTPICLPKFADKGFLYAYVCYLTADICLIVITADAQDFAVAREGKLLVEEGLLYKDCLKDVIYAMHHQNWTVDSTDISCPDLRHFLYRTDVNHGSTFVNQIVNPFPAHPFSSKLSQHQIFRRYQHLHDRASAYNCNEKRIMQAGMSMYYEIHHDCTVFYWFRPDEFELYATYLPLVSKETVFIAANRILRWIKKEETSLFIEK